MCFDHDPERDWGCERYRSMLQGDVCWDPAVEELPWEFVFQLMLWAGAKPLVHSSTTYGAETGNV